MIRLEHVVKHYPRGRETVRALDGVSLDIPQGTLALLRGPSGSGKTTLINCCAGLTLPTQGNVMVAGEHINKIDGRRRAALRARRIAVVFQMFHLIPYLTAMENILLPDLAHPGGASRARALELMDALQIRHRETHRPHEMSAGERQRCALARALLHRPEVILADEPTGNLDEESARLVLSMLEACRAEGATILLVSHHPVEHIQPGLEFHLRDGRLQ